jgi:hypothetical protein
MKSIRLLASCFVVITDEGRHRKETDLERTNALFCTYCLFVKEYTYGDDKVKFCVMFDRLGEKWNVYLIRPNKFFTKKNKAA